MLTRLIAVTVFFLAPVALAEQTVNKTAAASAQGEVEVSIVSGQVSVTAWDRNEVQVTGTLSDDDEPLQFVTEPTRTLIKIAPKKSATWLPGTDSDAKLAVQVPAGSRLSVNTVSGDVRVKGIKGAQHVQSVSGDLSGEIAGADIEARTVSGDVNLRGDGKPAVVTVTTVSGDAQVTHAAGQIVATSVSGDLHLGLDQITRARLRTTSGNLKLEGGLAPGAHVDAEAISGDLTFDFQNPVNAEIGAESVSGDIRNCFGPKAQSKSDHGPGSELNFKQGAGSASVRVKSLSGDISICSR